jgi:hypothetical protein
MNFAHWKSCHVHIQQSRRAVLDWGRIGLIATLSAAALVKASAVPALGQHADIAPYQDADGKIHAHDDTAPGEPELRVYERAFDFWGHPFGNKSLPKVFIGDDPGFQTTGTSPPPGRFALPGNATLQLNLLPLHLPNGRSGNLLHWDALGGMVEFDLPPENHTLTVQDRDKTEFDLDGSNTRFEGVIVGETDDLGGIHEHISFRVDDNDNNEDTDPAMGFYLFAIQMTMIGLTESDHVLIALSSPEVPSAIEDQVADWLETNFPQIPIAGDFDRNGEYQTADVDALVAEIAAGSHLPTFDLTNDGLVDVEDLDEWRAVAGAVLNESGSPILEGDANLDGTADGQDFVAWNFHKFTATAAWSSADFNADGFVDGQDFTIWNVNKFQTAGNRGGSVPEPPGLLHLLLLLPLILNNGQTIGNRLKRTHRGRGQGEGTEKIIATQMRCFEMTLIDTTPRITFAALCLACALPAWAQHSDIEVVIQDGMLVTEPRVGEGEFGEGGNPANFADEPGFEVDDGVFHAGEVLGFNAVAPEISGVSRNLWFWDGTGSVVFGGTPDIPTDHQLKIQHPLLPLNIQLTDATGASTVPGFPIGQADDEGGIHQDLAFLLVDNTMSDILPPANGVYLWGFEMTSPSYQASEPVYFVLGAGVDEATLDLAVDEVARLFNIPEPTATTLALVGLTAAGFVRAIRTATSRRMYSGRR